MRIPRSPLFAKVATTSLLLGVACTGRISDPGSASGAGASSASAPTETPPGGALGGSNAGPGGTTGAGNGGATDATTYERLTCETAAIGAAPLRRLTHAEYDHAVRDLLGDRTAPGQSFPLDTRSGLFDNTALLQDVPELLAEKYVESAAALADGVADLRGLVGCDYEAAAPGTCVQDFVARFGRRAYRRPLTAGERTSLAAVNDAAKTQADAASGIRAVIAATLASPHFLFRPEFGAGVGSVPDSKRLTAFELAARLASLLWASQSDDALLDAAERGELESEEQVTVQARRMLADPKARPALAAFYRQWLGGDVLDAVDKNRVAYPDWNDALRRSLSDESRLFLESVLWDGDARYATLLGANYSFVNTPLAALYGVTPPAAGESFARVELDPSQRSGILTQGAFLAAFAGLDESSPIKRGKWLRVRLLCQDLPDPPANVPELAAPAEGVSTRERFAQHSSNPACKGCHGLIDGLGFGLEQYDAIGRYRTSDHGVPVDARGTLSGTGEGDADYVGGRELGALLVKSERAADCVPTQWLRYAMARRETEDDTCSLAAVRDAFRDSGGDLRELMVALIRSDVFLNYRRPE
jgi:Protein of unknown function (DUF1592)/Protein of unknown function (DUF1588)/Protein of unknown function (DUF1595)/Protein of unknown function (DUF1587)/Protein of unknown function (DUF1585)